MKGWINSSLKSFYYCQQIKLPLKFICKRSFIRENYKDPPRRSAAVIPDTKQFHRTFIKGFDGFVRAIERIIRESSSISIRINEIAWQKLHLYNLTLDIKIYEMISQISRFIRIKLCIKTLSVLILSVSEDILGTP